MAGGVEKCRHCGVQLVVPPDTQAIRCAVCHGVTQLRSTNPFGHAQERIERAAGWFKGFVNRVSSNHHAIAASADNCSGSVTSGYGRHHAQPSPLPPQQVSTLSRPGRKRAVLCGVSYSGARRLKGTVNDVNCMRYFLVEKMCFPRECVLVLTEEEKDPFRIPTKRNIRLALQWLIHGCRSGDSLVFHFSGHGFQRRNYNGDETDGYDEMICPVDYETEGPILDDEINATIVRPLCHGAKLHAIIDSCHSGTILDLPFVCRIDRKGCYSWEDQSHTVAYKGTSGGLALSFSACDDHQTSVDTAALSGNLVTGVMTYSFIKAAQNEPGQTYGRLQIAMHNAIREPKTGLQLNGPIAYLVKGLLGLTLSQKPLLSSSEKFDIYKKPFIL
ncbi:metacaspase-3-like isoform X1 [Malania oleifera]|uniref:metacaspase-3-like isoform X1 n=1 Tax=Malania oleifera TaxID=397392 RepID=UPI0025ADF5AF|nr:metacaspase-3-like isoform X1 [Malania oleifera]